jgi:arsenate reductase-like glutaredoxin family protein
VTIRETISANEKLGAADALRLARGHASGGGAARVIVAKGKKVVTFDMKKDAPSDDELLAHLLGPTGNLRAPAILRGRTLLVGFNEDVYTDHIAK